MASCTAGPVLTGVIIPPAGGAAVGVSKRVWTDTPGVPGVSGGVGVMVQIGKVGVSDGVNVCVAVFVGGIGAGVPVMVEVGVRDEVGVFVGVVDAVIVGVGISW